MKIDILTLFPGMFEGFKTESIIKRAIEKGKVEINIIDIRDYTPYKNNQVDDYQFGGVAGKIKGDCLAAATLRYAIPNVYQNSLLG